MLAYPSGIWVGGEGRDMGGEGSRDKDIAI